MQMKFVSLVSTGALFGALGMVPQAAFAAFGVCPDTTLGQQRTSAVLSDVQPGTGGAPNVYNFKVCNTSGFSEGETQFLLRDWELPYDPTGQITNISAPEGWGWAIETIGMSNLATGWDGATPTWKDPSDPFHDPRYQNLDQVIHFYTCGGGSCYGTEGNVFGSPLRSGESLEGFGFTSPFGETNAPYQASWVIEPPRSGDPAFPLVGANTPGLLAVPEPGSLALFAAALGAMMAARARRPGRSDD